MKNVFSIIILLISTQFYAQDPVFSQSFLVPETLNTSFTGAIRTTKFGTLHKSQWRDSGLKTNSSFVFADFYIPQFRTGLGVTYLNQTENVTSYTFNQVNVNFALDFQISDTWYFRPSISVGFGAKSFGFQNLLLEDQINLNSNIVNTSSIDPLVLRSNRNFFDFSSSLLFNNQDSWVGLTVRHLNRPNISLTDSGNAPLDIFMSVHGKLHLPVFNNYRDSFWGLSKLYFLSNFMMQGQFNRLDVGSQYVFDDRFSFGIVAATNPMLSSNQAKRLTSVSTFAGIKLNGFRFGYSHEFNTTNIGNIGGTHEFSLSYDFTLHKSDIDRLKCVTYF